MEKRVFVGRERELERLNTFLGRALAGQGMVCFVTGEAGSGKTALLTEFARRAQEEYAELAVAVGQSDAQTGEGDPHLPFRELLAQLTGDVEAKLAQGTISQENAGRLRKLLVLSGQALVEVGPDLIGVFVPGVGLASRAGAFVAEKAGWLDKLERLADRPREPAGSSELEQGHIFEQYGNVLSTLSARRPLLLILDDLQWADAASLALLFRLGRRIGGDRILLAGTFRPEEVAIGRKGERHPLEKVLAELKRYYGEIFVDLDSTQESERQRFVSALLDTEPNRLPEHFGRELYQHTGGHPLLTVELLRAMQERGDLARDGEGCWVETPSLDWASLPTRVEGVIEERIQRLEQELCQALTVGSVEGEEFTAEVVARVQAADARTLVRRLSSELERQHRLVKGQGVRRAAAAGQRLSLFRFEHNLFRAYLYGELGAAERAYLHEDVGNALEELYGDRSGEIAVQLALHFGEAGVAHKARVHLRRAGEQAAARYANDEAIDYFSRALALTPESEAGERYALLLGREQILGLKAERTLQARDLAALQEAAELLDDDRKRAEVALRRSAYASDTSDYPAAVSASQEAVSLAGAVGDHKLEARGHRMWGSALRSQGDHGAARSQLEQALDLSRDAGLRQEEASAQRVLGLIAMYECDFQRARSCFGESLRIYSQEGNRVGESNTLMSLANVFRMQGDHARAQSYYEQALLLARETGDRVLEGMLLGNLGISAEVRGDFGAAMERFGQVAAVFGELGDVNSEALAWAHLGLNSTLQGAYDRGRAYCERALEACRAIGSLQREVYVRGILSWLLGKVGSLEEATAHGREALRLAQELGSPGYGATAWTALAEIHALRGEFEQATEAYRRGLEIHQEIGAHNLMVEDQAGLARVALAEGNLPQAGELVDKILSYAEKHAIQVGNDNPLEVYLTCYRVLRALEDVRAGEVLATARHLLQEQVSRIGDQALRRSYLENVRAPRELMLEFDKEANGWACGESGSHAGTWSS